MDDLIGRLVANAGVDRTAADKAGKTISFAREMQGTTQSATSSARSPAWASSSDAC
jgi:hypothetical protein